ncbi:hypothetical protein WA1_46530 [Scytonema hofmannii PCC 7110]|uniref:Uncharacterized protein n=1 Tax=Scytonema hofmannii PCC 7110 TaxID=128403 RepID=A0A139WXF9_9CYAN|nr:hypothetical protein WA1_46530 [Scytonema hofmannii PCC 7110]
MFLGIWAIAYITLKKHGEWGVGSREWEKSVSFIHKRWHAACGTLLSRGTIIIISKKIDFSSKNLQTETKTTEHVFPCNCHKYTMYQDRHQVDNW